MKHTLLLFLLAFSSLMGYAQYTRYDSAARYSMAPSFFTAMDTLIAQAVADHDDMEK